MAMERIPVGLSCSMFVAAVSLGTMVILWNTERLAPAGPANLVHSAAILCLGWATLAWLPQRRWPRLAGSPLGHDLLAALDIGAMIMGEVVFILMLYVAVTEGFCRTVEFRYGQTLRTDIWLSGFADLSAVAAAVLLGYQRTRNRRLVTALFWLLTFACLWGAFRIPAVSEVRTASGHAQAVATDWTSPFILGSAAVLAAFTIAGGVVEHRRRVAAWPARLAELRTRLEPWPGFLYSAGLVAVVILILGCVHVVKPWTSLAAFLAGGSLLVLVARRWNANLADAGLALITLGVVSLAMFSLPPRRGESGPYYAAVFSRVVVALAIMVWFWHWLAGVWDQQLNNGRPWTTAGRLIGLARRVGFILGALAVLVSLHLSFWPMRPNVIDPDASLDRWLWGLGANGLLILVLGGAACRTGKATLAWLSLFAAAPLVAFVLVRSPTCPVSEWTLLHWPIPMVGVAGIALLGAHGAARSKHGRAFVEPLHLMGVLVAPMAAILGIAGANPLTMSPWIPAATYGALVAVYLLAAVLTGPRTFAAVAVMCAAVALYHLRELTRMPNIASLYAGGMLAGLSLLLLGVVYGQRAGPRCLHLMKLAGGALLLGSMIAGLIASRP